MKTTKEYLEYILSCQFSCPEKKKSLEIINYAPKCLVSLIFIILMYHCFVFFSEKFDNPNKNSNESKYQLKAICEAKSKEKKDAANKVNYNTTNLLTPNRAVLR